MWAHRAMIVSALALASLTAHADEATDKAIEAGLADCLTTAAALGIGRGMVEANPLGPVVACALKAPAIGFAATQPEPSRTNTLSAIDAMWTGAAVNNGVGIGAVLLHASVGPWAPLTIGAAAGLYAWHESADRREKAYLCASLREYAGKPDMPCTFL